MAYYYSVDHHVSDPIQQLEIATKYTPDEPLEWLAKDAERTHLGAFIATPRKVGLAGSEWGVTFDIEPVREAA